MAKANKKTTKANGVTALPANNNLPQTAPETLADMVVGLNDTGIKTVTMLAAAILFAAPAFATQANPQNIVALADLFYKYATGGIKVNQPNEAVEAVAQAPTFG